MLKTKIEESKMPPDGNVATSLCMVQSETNPVKERTRALEPLIRYVYPSKMPAELVLKVGSVDVHVLVSVRSTLMSGNAKR